MSLNNLKKRLIYNGGNKQIDRMVEDKKRSFERPLSSSYQSATAILSNGNEFKCLINPNKISMEIDDKMLSISFDSKVSCGDIIEWKENGTHWIVYSQYLQEVAYFRGLMRQCADESLEIDGKQFWYYLKGPDEKSIDWQKTKHFIFNDLNYTLEIYISNTKETNEFFQRFKKCKIKGKTFTIQAVDSISLNGILTVYLKEDYVNEWEGAQDQPVSITQDDFIDPSIPHIEGEMEIYPYDIKVYKVSNASDGRWLLSNNRAKIIQQDSKSVTIEVTTGKSSSFDLIYRCESMNDIISNIKILSL